MDSMHAFETQRRTSHRVCQSKNCSYANFAVVLGLSAPPVSKILGHAEDRAADTDGSASTTSLSRPAQALLALRPARLLARATADFCPEASPRPCRSLATTSYRQLQSGGSSSHW